MAKQRRRHRNQEWRKRIGEKTEALRREAETVEGQKEDAAREHAQRLAFLQNELNQLQRSRTRWGMARDEDRHETCHGPDTYTSTG